MGLFDFLKKPPAKAEHKGPDLAVHLSFEHHELSEAESEIERQENNLILELVEASVIRSAYFMPEKVPQLMKALRDPPTFARLNTKTSEVGNGLLSKEEKQALGLNTRRKYSREFIGYFCPDALRTIEPISTPGSMQSDAFHRVSRTFALRRFKKIELIKKLTIESLGGCEKVQRIKNTYDIDEVPELPLPGCDQECKCYYEAVLPKIKN